MCRCENVGSTQSFCMIVYVRKNENFEKSKYSKSKINKSAVFVSDHLS